MRKQILSLAVALLIGSTVCMAQNRQNGKADREKRMEQIVADLGLNEKQAKDFKAAMKEMRPAKINRMKGLRGKKCKRKGRK